MTLEAPEGFKIIDEAKFAAWASMTKVPREKWGFTMKRRKRIEVWSRGLERIDPSEVYLDNRIEAMTNKDWTEGNLTVRRRIIKQGRVAVYRYAVDGLGRPTLCDDPAEVLRLTGMVVE